MLFMRRTDDDPVHTPKKVEETTIRRAQATDDSTPSKTGGTPPMVNKAKEAAVSSSDKQLVSTALLRRTILPHGWICCREPERVFVIGSQNIFLDDNNLYVDNDISDQDFQKEFAKLSCLPSYTCSWLLGKVRPTLGRRVTVIRLDEILAVSSESAWELKVKICGCAEDQIQCVKIYIGLGLFWFLLIPCCIMMPKLYKDKNDLAADMYISVRRYSRDYTAVVPVERIGEVAEIIMTASTAPVGDEMKR
jgi:hypothetical protein